MDSESCEKLREMIRALKENNCVALNLNRHEAFGIGECLTVIRALPTNTSLQELNLKGKSIGADGSVAVALANALSEKHCTLKTLVLESNYIGSEGCVAMANALKINSSLEELEFYNNHVGNAGAAALADMLTNSTNSNIKELSLGLNFIENEGCCALANALRNDTTKLEVLDLGNNKIGDQGVIELAKALMHKEKDSASLKQLNLYGNKDITSVGLQALLDMLETNHRLQFLSIDYWPRSELKSKIQFMLKLNRLGLRQIDFEADGETTMKNIVTAKSDEDLSVMYHLIRQNPAVCGWMVFDAEQEDESSLERPRQRRRMNSFQSLAQFFVNSISGSK